MYIQYISMYTICACAHAHCVCLKYPGIVCIIMYCYDRELIISSTRNKSQQNNNNNVYIIIASVAGLPRSGRVLIMRMFAAYRTVEAWNRG